MARRRQKINNQQTNTYDHNKIEINEGSKQVDVVMID